MNHPPSKLQMGPQQAVAGGGTSKSGGGADKAIYTVLSSSFTQVLHFSATLSCPRHPHPNLHNSTIARFPILSIKIFVILG